MNWRIFLSAIAFTSITNFVEAQDQDSTEYTFEYKVEKVTIPRATIKINIPCLTIDPKRNLFISTDTRINKFLSMDMGAGPYLDSWYYNEYKDETIRGIRTRLGVKYYYTFGGRVAPYFGAEGMFNRYTVKNYEEVCRNGCQFIQTMLIGNQTQAYGVALRAGFQVFMGKTKKTFFDIYGGLGIKITDRTSGLPEDGELFFRASNLGITDGFQPGHFQVPNIILGAHLGYSFR